MSYFKPRNLLLVMALALALILLAVIALRYRPASQLQTLVQTLPKGVDVSMQDIDYTHLEKGQARWRLVARQVARQADTGLLAVNRPRMSFFDAQGEPSGSLEADRGEVSDDYQTVRLIGQVVLKNPEGYTLYTAHLDYDQASQTATTDARVQLVGDGVQLEGTGLEFNVPKRLLHLKADVVATFEPAKRE
jgi:LPS export ABC transporter protein LptC